MRNTGESRGYRRNIKDTYGYGREWPEEDK